MMPGLSEMADYTAGTQFQGLMSGLAERPIFFKLNHCGRQVQVKNCAAPDGSLGPQASTMRLND